MNPIAKKWAIYSYQLPLNKELAVLGAEKKQRKGLLLAKKMGSDWKFAELAPLPNFHPVSLEYCFQEIQRYFQKDIMPTSPISQFAIWSLTQKGQQGSLSLNGLSSLQALPNHVSFQTMKLKVGRHSLKSEIQHFRQWATRYPNIQFRLDANRSWSLDQLRSFYQETNDLNIEYFEDPLSDPLDYERIIDIPIALDESLAAHSYLITHPAITHLIIKPTLHTMNNIVQWAKASKPLVFTSTFETSIGLWNIGQLALQYSPSEKHGLATLDWFVRDPVQESLLMTGDHIFLHSKPPLPDLRFFTLEASQ